MVGAILKRERLSQGIALEEVAEVTNINIHILRALEENDRESLPAEVFVRGFITLYAGFLSLDPEEILARYRQQEADITNTGNSLNAHAIVRLTSVTKDLSTSPYRLIVLIISVFLFFVVLILGT